MCKLASISVGYQANKCRKYELERVASELRTDLETTLHSASDPATLQLPNCLLTLDELQVMICKSNDNKCFLLTSFTISEKSGLQTTAASREKSPAGATA